MRYLGQDLLKAFVEHGKHRSVVGGIHLVQLQEGRCVGSHHVRQGLKCWVGVQEEKQYGGKVRHALHVAAVWPHESVPVHGNRWDQKQYKVHTQAVQYQNQ